jgi:protocatechuate 3,4-dioxygenase beta subunit
VYLVVTLPLIASTDIEPGPPVDTILIESAAAIGAAAATASFERDLVVGGIVVDGANRPVAGARVDLLSAIGVRTAARSNDNGEFTLPGLEPGVYRLRCSHPDHQTPIPQAVTVPLPSGAVRLVLS